MAADKLAQFVASGEFLKRANAAITEAVRELEAKGIKPAYVMRQASDLAAVEPRPMTISSIKRTAA